MKLRVLRAIVCAGLGTGCGAGNPVAAEPAGVSATGESAVPAPRVSPAHDPVSSSRANAAESSHGEAPVQIAEAPAPISFGRIRSMVVSGTLPSADVSQPAARAVAFRHERTVQVGRSHLTFAAVSPRGSWLFAASEDEAKLRLYSFPAGKLLANHAVPGFVRFGRGDFQTWPVGDEPQVLFGSDDGILLLDARSGEVVRTLSVRPTWSLRWTRDHRVLGALHARIPAQTSALAFYVPTESGELEERLALELTERADDWALDSTGTELSLVFYPSGTVETVSLAERRVLWTFSAPRYGHSLDRSADDRWIAVGGDRLVVLDARDPSKHATFTGYQNNLHAVRFTPGSAAVVTTSYDGRARIVGIEARGPELPLLGTLRHAGSANVYAASFSPDGSRLVTSSGDKTLKIWKR